MKAARLILAVIFVAVAVSCKVGGGGGGGKKVELTVSPNSLPAGGGSVSITYKTSGFLAGVPFTLVSNPPLSGFPIAWTGDMSDSFTLTVTKTTTFTLSNAPSGTDVTSKTVSVP